MWLRILELCGDSEGKIVIMWLWVWVWVNYVMRLIWNLKILLQCNSKRPMWYSLKSLFQFFLLPGKYFQHIFFVVKSWRYKFWVFFYLYFMECSLFFHFRVANEIYLHILYLIEILSLISLSTTMSVVKIFSNKS